MPASSSRVSYLAVTSLVLGMAFFVPILTGLAAIVAGLIALKTIRHSESQITGKGIAVTGIALGSIQALYWVFIVIIGLTFSVEQHQTAVVVRDGKAVRVEGPGTHYKIPNFESVELFPTSEYFKLEISKTPLILKSRKIVKLNVSVIWNICGPLNTYNKFGSFNHEMVKLAVKQNLISELRTMAARASGIRELLYNENTGKELEGRFSVATKPMGVCIKTLNLVEPSDR